MLCYVDKHVLCLRTRVSKHKCKSILYDEGLNIHSLYIHRNFVDNKHGT